jgi:hypothetical protein
MNLTATLDELEKLGAISADEARRTLDRLDSVEKGKPTGVQAAQYGTLGAGAGALTRGVSHYIEHGKLPTTRSALGAAAGGAIGLGAVPLIRTAVDRHRERSKLREFMKQSVVKTAENEEELKEAPAARQPISFHDHYKTSMSASQYSTPIEGAKPNRMVSEGPMRSAPIVSPFPKLSFAVSQYSGPLSMGPFRMASGLPPFTAPSLRAGFTKKQDALQMAKSSAMAEGGLTPKSLLSSGQRIGKAKITNPSGPSIGDLSKPIGFGSKLPGATKGTL